MLHQPELAVELIVQRGLQQGVPGGGVDQKIGALGIGIDLRGDLLLLQGGITAVHQGIPFSLSGHCPRWNSPISLRMGAVSFQLVLDCIPRRALS